MAKTLQFDNNTIMYDATEVATLKLPNSVGSNVTLTLDDNSDLSQNDYLLIGKLGYPKSEIVKINAAVVAGTSIQVDSLTFIHNFGTPITKINYNQVEVSRAETSTGSKTLLDTINIDADDQYTSYRDLVYSSGDAFFRLKNETTGEVSGYSAAYSYSCADDGTIEKVKQIIKHYFNKDIDEKVLDMLINSVAQEVYSMRLWKFREATTTFNSVASTADYTLSTAGITDLSSIVYITYDGDPVWPTNVKRYKAQNWNVSATGIPRTYLLWDDTLRFTPSPSTSSLEISVWYYKNHSTFSSNAATVSLELPNVIAYGVLRDLWGPIDKNKLNFFSSRYNEKILALKKNDQKQQGIFEELTHVMEDITVNDQVKFPNNIIAET